LASTTVGEGGGGSCHGIKDEGKHVVKRIDVTKKNDEWVAKSGKDTVAKAPTKDEAVRRTAKAARAMPEAVSVKIHKVDNTIQEERTYPRSADPRKSKG
jgi:hypothetical protein